MSKLKNFRIRGNNKEVRKLVKDLCEQIVRAVHPQKIILFGSYAYGRPNEDSDIDLLVVMPFEGHPAYQAANIRMQVESRMPMALLVRTPEFLAERIALGDFFIQEVIEEGKVIYEADYPVVDQQGGRRLDNRAA